MQFKTITYIFIKYTAHIKKNKIFRFTNLKNIVVI